MDKYIGIDLHSNNSVVVVAEAEDRVVFQGRLPNNPDRCGGKDTFVRCAQNFVQCVNNPDWRESA